MRLTQREKRMARGEEGPGVARCMEILIKFAEAFDAPEMVEISSAHIMPLEPPELLLGLTEGITQMAVFTTVHPWMSACDPSSWQQMGVPEAFARRELPACETRVDVYRRLGVCQTYTCLPMLVGNLPRQDQVVSWVGSGAQLIANSLLGARCNRDAVVALASAVTGRTPLRGLLLDEDRRARVAVRFEDREPGRLSDVELSAAGYYLGARAGGRNIAIEGLPKNMPLESLKSLIAPLAVTGAVGVCHMVGVTPEAPTREAALGNRKPEEDIVVTGRDIRESLDRFAGDGEKVDMVVLGCPHCTIPDVKRIAAATCRSQRLPSTHWGCASSWHLPSWISKIPSRRWWTW